MPPHRQACDVTCQINQHEYLYGQDTVRFHLFGRSAASPEKYGTPAAQYNFPSVRGLYFSAEVPPVYVMC